MTDRTIRTTTIELASRTIDLPVGYEIERTVWDDEIRTEVVFTLKGPDGRTAFTPTVRRLRNDSWYLHPGGSSSEHTADEADARAVTLSLAAQELRERAS